MANINQVKFAPVAPVGIFEKLIAAQAWDAVGNYHLLLAHDVVKKKDRWRDVISAIRDRFDSYDDYNLHSTIILDTSVIELGVSEEWEALEEAAEVIRPDIIVIPDVIGDATATIKHLNEARTRGWIRTDKRYMYVPQGRTFEEYLLSMQVVLPPQVTCLGIPRDALKFTPSRVDLVRASQIIDPTKDIHLLGFSDNLWDDFKTAHACPFVVGIDSAVPIRAGIEGNRVGIGKNDYGKRFNGYLDYEGDWNETLVSNVMDCRKWLRHHRAEGDWFQFPLPFDSQSTK